VQLISLPRRRVAGDVVLDEAQFAFSANDAVVEVALPERGSGQVKQLINTLRRYRLEGSNQPPQRLPLKKPVSRRRGGSGTALPPFNNASPS
jgi:hypothetical protein